MLDAPAAKGAILRRNVEKIVVRVHSDKIFSVMLFMRQGLASKAGSILMGIFHAVSPTYAEEIGTSLRGFDARQVATWLGILGYDVELVHVSPAREPTAR
jgi:hypothetical protein